MLENPEETAACAARILWIGHRLPSLNEALAGKTANVRRFWGKTGRFSRSDAYSRQKEETENEIALLARRDHFVELREPASQTVLFLESGRRDHDNVLTGLKFVNDALHRAGLIPNDSPKWIRSLAVYVERSASDGVLVAFADSTLSLTKMRELLKLRLERR